MGPVLTRTTYFLLFTSCSQRVWPNEIRLGIDFLRRKSIHPSLLIVSIISAFRR